MKYEQWRLPQAAPERTRTLTAAGYPHLIAQVLAARGVETATQAAEALERERGLSLPPLLMRDMDCAVARIRRALERGERIAVFGDYDVDGITATCLLTDYLRSRGADVSYHIPHRIEEGYGLGCEALRVLREQGVSLVITVDCGITGVEEAAYAASIGLELVITDHHECKETLPAACAVVDPHRSDCPYPFKHLAGVGVALKLVLALGGPEHEDALFARYCTLAAIGTIADVMRMEDENRTIVCCGLDAVGRSSLVGLHALLREAGLEGKALTSTQVGFILAPRINAAGRMGQAELAAELLLTPDAARAELLARQLCELNRERQSIEQEIFRRAIEQLEQLPGDERSAIVLSSHEWHQGVVGIVASRLCEKFSCPSFMIHLTDGMGKGSCRSAGALNLFNALEACSDLLAGFGGHALAAGFTIREENIPAFRRKMNEYVRSHCTGRSVSTLQVDAVLEQPSLVTLEEVAALDALEPYGAGNNRPVFCLLGATVEALSSVGQNKHLKLRLQKGRVSFDAIFFSATAEGCALSVGSRVDAAFYLQINEFRGVRSVQLQIIDLRASREPSAREAEALSLCHTLLHGGTLSAKDAARLLPTREQFVAAWRMLAQLPGETLTLPELPLLRRLAAAAGGSESFARACLCMCVFTERGLLECSAEDGELTLRLTAQGKKVDLEQSPCVLTLRRLLQPTNRGEAHDR